MKRLTARSASGSSFVEVLAYVLVLKCVLLMAGADCWLGIVTGSLVELADWM
jgi:hypothetical protein